MQKGSPGTKEKAQRQSLKVEGKQAKKKARHGDMGAGGDDADLQLGGVEDGDGFDGPGVDADL